MKRLILLSLALALTGATLSAQALSRPEHNIQLGLGTFVYGGQHSLRNGQLAARLSYGLDIPVAGAWSVMPEVGVKLFQEGIFAIGAVGADFDSFSYLDFTLSCRYRTPNGLILGLGPMLSYTWHPGRYYVDADPNDPLNRKAKNKPFNLSLRPGIYWDAGRRWRFGVEAELGVLNTMVQYPELNRTGSKHIHAIRFVTGLHF